MISTTFEPLNVVESLSELVRGRQRTGIQDEIILEFYLTIVSKCLIDTCGTLGHQLLTLGTAARIFGHQPHDHRAQSADTSQRASSNPPLPRRH